eukprot:12516660-Heterocapsa_arctica.AAC.1
MQHRVKEGMAIAAQKIKAQQETAATFGERHAKTEEEIVKAYAYLRRQAKQAGNTAHPDDVRFNNL